MSGSTDKPEGRRASRGSGARKATKSDAESQRPTGEAASRLIDERIRSLGGWRGETLAEVRRLIREADPNIVEDGKWIKSTNPLGVPVWSHAGIICTGVLTGPQSLTQCEQVATIGDVIGRPLRFEEMSPEAARREWRAPAPVVDMLLKAWEAAIGQPALVTATVAEITGTPARTFRDWVTDHAAEFRA